VSGIFGHLLTKVSAWFTKSPEVGDGPLDEIYSPYTTEFDLEIDAVQLAATVGNVSPDRSRGWLELGDHSWSAAINDAQTIYQGLRLDQANDLELENFSDPQNTIVAILIDQSGSMKGKPIAQTAAMAKMLTEDLVKTGAKVELLGYSTAGWHGGFARKLWISNGRPRRPGRLCALTHIIYKTANDLGLDEERWRAMLNPDLLRENVDGEAILWAANRLRQRSEGRKVLIVVSDGAPVDDSTLTQNGPSYLERHLLGVIASIEADPAIELAAIGIGYAVDRYYRNSAVAKSLTELRRTATAVLKTVLQ
jgi:cobaltochelatase CobT